MFLIKTLSLATLALTVLNTQVQAHPRALSYPHNGTSVEDVNEISRDLITWIGSATPGGPNLTIRGSVEEIAARIVELNPEHELAGLVKRDDGIKNEEVEEWKNGTQGSQEALQRRGDYPSNWPPDCIPAGMSFQYAPLEYIQDGIKYLRGIGGDCNLPAGPRFCSRVSCSWGSGIFWCNDGPAVSIPCAELGNYAQGITDVCTFTQRSTSGVDQIFTGGQLFNKRGQKYDWNVIIKSQYFDKECGMG